MFVVRVSAKNLNVRKIVFRLSRGFHPMTVHPMDSSRNCSTGRLNLSSPPAIWSTFQRKRTIHKPNRNCRTFRVSGYRKWKSENLVFGFYRISPHDRIAFGFVSRFQYQIPRPQLSSAIRSNSPPKTEKNLVARPFCASTFQHQKLALVLQEVVGVWLEKTKKGKDSLFPLMFVFLLMWRKLCFENSTLLILIWEDRGLRIREVSELGDVEV